MSIIQEALKKIGPSEGIEKSSGRGPEIKTISGESVIGAFAGQVALVRRKKQRRDKGPLALTVVFIVIGLALFLSIAAGFLILFGKSRPSTQGDIGLQQVKNMDIIMAGQQEAIYKTLKEESDGNISTQESMYSVVRSQPPKLVLNGIMHLETGARAVINNNIVQEGDMIDGATVVLINRNSVILKYNSLEITLNLK